MRGAGPERGDLVAEIREPATATAVSCGDDLTDFQSQSQDGNTAIFPLLPVGAAEPGYQEELGILGLPKIGNTDLYIRILSGNKSNEGKRSSG